jgi:hypothetical protein
MINLPGTRPTVRVRDDRIHWAAYLKHTNIEITTESIRLEDLERIAQVFRRSDPTKEG